MMSPRGVLKSGTLPVVVGLVMLGGGSVSSESLWEPAFAGLIVTEQTLRIGDLVTVEVDAATSLEFEASATDNKAVSLTLSGGDLGDLFSFLPSGGSSGDLATAGGQSYAVAARVGARVVETDARGNARLEGTRTVALSSREESLTVAGWLDSRVLDAMRVVRFSELADGVLSITSFLAPAAPILTAADLVSPEVLPGDAAAGAGLLLAPAAAPDVADLLAAAGQTDLATQQGAGQPQLGISDERQQQLLLQYLNRLIDLVFQ